MVCADKHKSALLYKGIQNRHGNGSALLRFGTASQFVKQKQSVFISFCKHFADILHPRTKSRKRFIDILLIADIGKHGGKKRQAGSLQNVYGHTALMKQYKKGNRFKRYGFSAGIRSGYNKYTRTLRKFHVYRYRMCSQQRMTRLHKSERTVFRIFGKNAFVFNTPKGTSISTVQFQHKRQCIFKILNKFRQRSAQSSDNTPDFLRQTEFFLHQFVVFAHRFFRFNVHSVSGLRYFVYYAPYFCFPFGFYCQNLSAASQHGKFRLQHVLKAAVNRIVFYYPFYIFAYSGNGIADFFYLRQIFYFAGSIDYIEYKILST